MTARLEALLSRVSGPDPSGPNLEYDPAFSDLERLAAGRPERQMGSQIIPAEDPDHAAVVRLANDLLGRSKDLRIAARLTRSWLATEGLPGLASGLQVMHGLLEALWESVHPQLDPDDRSDVAIRSNVFAALSDLSFLAAVRGAPLVEARGLGRFSLKDIQAAAQPAAGPDGAPRLSAATIEAAFGAADRASLANTAAAVRAAEDHLLAIEAVFAERAGATSGPDLSKLAELLEQIRRHLDRALAAGAEPASAAAPTEPSTTAATPGALPTAPAARPGEIRSREDVVLVLDTICDYYARHEPSSPVPLLLKRARRLVTASFLDIVRDIAPDSLSQFLLLQGREGDGSGS